MTHLSEQTALATLHVIDQYLPKDFDTLGITAEEFQHLSGSTPFLRPHMSGLVRTMNALIFGTLEVMTLPKLIVPSEYIAAVISAVVHPCNVMAMCVIMATERQTGVGAMELAARNSQSSQTDHTSADQLFALCVILNNQSRANHARTQLRKQLGLAIEKATEGKLN